MAYYSTKNEAIKHEIETVLGSYAREHDTEAIADEVLELIGVGDRCAFRVREDVNFWEIVEKHAY